MLICKVTGKVVSTIKNESLVGMSLILVRPLSFDAKGNEVVGKEVYVAADPFGCGVDHCVLVTQGSNARFALGDGNAPVDMAVVGIID
ncbi:MAG: ethanolamine utilization protein EutN [Clostridiales bacterium]|nr:ethanolamine utilization protein EutN [Clostridiales bacterium]